VSRAQRSVERSGTVRCRPGTFRISGGPGQHSGIAFALELDIEIASFQAQRRPHRFYPTIDPTKPGRPKPLLHPIVIEGIGPIPLGKGYE
jgi:hypothetical protein